jgi:hypothetical protein
VAIDGLTPSITGIIKRGDFFKFAGHSKVYQADADIDSNGSGQATLTFFPALLAAVADNEGITSSGAVHADPGAGRDGRRSTAAADAGRGGVHGDRGLLMTGPRINGNACPAPSAASTPS